MIIEEKDFRLTPVSEESPMFDLELLHTIKPRGKESREEFKNSGYGLPLESAIKRIVMYRLSKKHKEEAINLNQFFKEYKTELEDLIKLCTLQKNSLTK